MKGGTKEENSKYMNGELVFATPNVELRALKSNVNDVVVAIKAVPLTPKDVAIVGPEGPPAIVILTDVMSAVVKTPVLPSVVIVPDALFPPLIVVADVRV